MLDGRDVEKTKLCSQVLNQASKTNPMQPLNMWQVEGLKQYNFLVLKN